MKREFQRNILNMKVEGKGLMAGLILWEEQVRKDVTQKEGRPWEETGDEKLWDDRDR
jgi:hypothetical protein